ncbi:cobaltochelatase subunit CobN [Clostridium cochlearium]|uniref:cobaltochelatase subunit CobN n=2 Tax=Clostridium TaxID=1485 RepID=UPI00241ED79F|nr:cobaltochelatase subunit CobN [Clostridium cochlearium]MBE6064239.1 hypothetical protein [Clostridium cochlearium]
MERNYVYPFAAVIGQEKVKKALILNVINPSIGGVLISGEKGTAKSTLVRGLANLMKNMQVIDLPLNVTEDKLLGTIDIEKAIVKGERSFESGILKKAHGNILYVDEVNLLSEHIVNCLLEVSASGVNHVEREGISFKHPSNFVLVGTMNPEEGNLRSQFLDRFGLYLDVKGSMDLSERKEIIKRRLKYEENPVDYINVWKEETEKLLNKILKAKNCLKKVKVSESVMNIAAQISNEANCSGHRAELVIVETAKAISAFDNRKNITIEDVKEAAELALPHRMRENPPQMNEPQENEESHEPEKDNEDKEDNSQQDNNPNNEEQQQEANDGNDNEDEDLEEDEQDNEDKEEGNPEDNLDDNEQEQDNEDEDNDETVEYGKKISLNIRKNFEIAGLLKAMNGKYLNASLAGDVIRNPEILPSGYNLYQFDPTLVPTETAYKRGASIAKKTIELYYKENKRYPWTTAMILWGLETSRTGGETIGQILYYLGVRPVKTGNSFKSAYEIIPIEELKRPRIDITINICGFFRDMFPNLIEDLNKIFYEIHSLDETFEENYFKKNSKDIYDELIKNGTDEETAKELCISRIFGPKEAEYGTGITKLLETKAWEEEVEIGKNFIDSLKYVYSKNFRGKEVEGLYTNNLKTVDVVSQVRSNHEYELTDLDHYYEFFGGLSKSIEMIKGEKPSMYISDTTGERVETETVDKSINRGIRTRILNPKWIDGMLEHKYHGVQKIADRFENILGLAATTNSVEQWIYNDLHKKYIENEKLRKRLQENNPYAYVTIVEWMMEYNQRRYWDASDEQLKELRDVYLEAEGLVEEL